MSTKIFRKTISLLLTFAMLLSLSSFSVLATGTEPVGSGMVVQNGTQVTSSDGNVTVQKTAEKVPGENDTFDITLKVTTNDKVETETRETAAHVVLLIDTSGSMTKERITNAKSAATTFVNTMLGANAAENNKVAVVTYAKFASEIIGLNHSKDAVNTQINTIGKTGNGGTNIQAGIKMAQDILVEGSETGVKNIIVLLSDGRPTYSYKLTGTAIWTGCTTDWWGNHDWEDGWYERGQVVVSTIQITGTTESQAGNGSDYATSNNISLTYTCAHGKTRSGNYSYNGTNIDSANHGVATRWQAKAAKDAGTEIYSVLLMPTNDGDYSTANSVMRDIASSNDHYKSTGDMTALAALFQKISEDITTPTTAGLVIDPMGAFITYVSPLDNVAATYDDDERTLTWDTSKSTPVSSTPTTKTYTFTYRVKLGTSAQGFVQDHAYAANGTTIFNYTVGTEPKSVNFDVPTVSGKTPMVEYSIRYYLQGNATAGSYGDYTLDTFSTHSGKLHTQVVLSTIDPNFESKYASQYYSIAQYSPSLTLTGGGLTLDVYYNHQTVQVTVEHYLKTTTIAAEGTETIGDYQEITGTTVNAMVNKGDSYTASKLNNPNYAFVAGDSDPLTVNPVLANTTIKLYYTTTVDNRAAASVTVFHKYNTYVWELVGNVYTKRLVEGTSQKITEATDLRATSPYPASTADVNGHSYVGGSAVAKNGSSTLPVTEGTGTVSFNLGAGANTLTLTFVKDVPTPSASEATIKVTHKYTKNVTTIVGGVPVVHTTAHGDVVEYLPADGKYYAGETRTVFANKTQPGGGDTYSVAGDSQKTITLTAGENEVTFEYHLESAPAQTTVTVNHIFRTFEEYTTSEGGTETSEVEAKRITDTPIMLTKYVGEKFTAELNPNGHSGYTLNKTDSNEYEDVIASGGKVITLYYDKDETEDNRDDASIQVTHTYYANVTKVVGGTVQTVREPAGTEDTVTINGKVGDPYEATPIISHGGHSDWVRTDTSSLTGTFASGTNSTIALVYERSADERVPASYVVNYYYYDWTMTIKDGKAGYYEGQDYVLNDKAEGISVRDKYVGERISLTDALKANYVASLNNPALTQLLTDSNNTYNFTYVKQIPLSKVNVNVTHNYELTTISATGEPSVSNTSTPANLTGDIYTGETVNVPSAKQNYTPISVTVTSGESSVTYAQADNSDISFIAPAADAAVIFNYKKTDNNSVPASYTIEHYYRTKDWDGSFSDYKLDNSGAKNTSGSSYATKTVAFVIYDENGNVKDEIVVTGGTVSEQVLTLVAGENTIKVYYTQEIDSRIGTRVKVVHNYYSLDTYTSTHSTTPEKTVVEYVEAWDAQEKLVLWVGGTYTAVPVYTYTVGSSNYTAAKFDPATPNNPAGLTIGELAEYREAGEDSQEQVNTIIINYLREYSSYSPPYYPPDPTDPPGPTTPTTPTPPIEIPEEETPLAPGPVIDGGEVEIPEGEAPLAPAPEVELTDEATPLADKTIPQTGDSSNTPLFALLAALSVFGLGALHLKPRKKTED